MTTGAVRRRSTAGRRPLRGSAGPFPGFFGIFRPPSLPRLKSGRKKRRIMRKISFPHFNHGKISL
ncbi:MAG: hypothetical protein C6W56_00965 [Caldibacillus debilis]|nr:MAG: hypothetical protein C6W56_00965 [Caldibacillus debilis]